MAVVLQDTNKRFGLQERAESCQYLTGICSLLFMNKFYKSKLGIQFKKYINLIPYNHTNDRKDLLIRSIGEYWKMIEKHVGL